MGPPESVGRTELADSITRLEVARDLREGPLAKAEAAAHAVAQVEQVEPLVPVAPWMEKTLHQRLMPDQAAREQREPALAPHKAGRTP